MSDEDDFFDDIDDIIDDEADPSDASPMGYDGIADEDEDEEEDEEEPVEVRTVVMSKNGMMALLSLKTFATGGQIVRIDPRQSLPSAQTYEDGAAALKWFKRSIATSEKNGWNIVYHGEPLFG